LLGAFGVQAKAADGSMFDNIIEILKSPAIWGSACVIIVGSLCILLWLYTPFPWNWIVMWTPISPIGLKLYRMRQKQELHKLLPIGGWKTSDEEMDRIEKELKKTKPIP